MTAMKRACITFMALLVLLPCFSTLALAAGGRITVTYNNGGSIDVLSAVKIEGNVIYVEDDSKVEIVAVPNDGYEVAGVYLNDQSMNISGSGPQTILVAPKGTSVTLRITFIKSENMDGYTKPETATPSPTPAPDEPSLPPAETTQREPTPEQTPTPPPQATTTPKTESTDAASTDEPVGLPNDTPDAGITEPNPDADISPEISASPATPPVPSQLQQEPSVITTEISNGGVGGLTELQMDSGNKDRMVTVIIVAGSLAVAAAITIIIVKKGNQR